MITSLVQINSQVRETGRNRYDAAKNAPVQELTRPESPPDVYYFILDSYGRADLLGQAYGYDNSGFLQGLEERGFFVAECSMSNYVRTEISLGSTLNMMYLQDLDPAFVPESTRRAVLWDSLKHRAVRYNLEEMGYKTIAFATGFADAVEAGIKPVERNPEDHTVGYSGLPNLLGEVEVDASIMDGRTLQAGAVGGVRNCLHAISVARKVMEELPHVLLVGAGAERFAREMGFPETDLLTPDATAIWQEIFDTKVPDVYEKHMAYVESMRRYAKLAADPERPNETVNFIARDAKGNLATGVSTSGWSWKYPGRLGDSPIVGAGNYADNRYGAAACTGRGEMAMRLCTAHSVVTYLKMGMDLEAAGRQAIAELGYLVDPYFGRVA